MTVVQAVEGARLTTVVMTNPWVRYEFFVAARNAIGLSDKTSQAGDGSPAICITPSTAPERNPAGVCTRLGGPHQLIIVWEVSHVACFTLMPNLHHPTRLSSTDGRWSCVASASGGVNWL